jgi:serine/threonine-protein kinase
MLQAGVTLGGRYVLRERIASGGMGEVWRGEDTLLRRAVALKVLLPRLSADPGFAARFRAEARAMAALSHPGIVEIYDYDHTDRTAYLVMQYVQGQSLQDILTRQGTLPAEQTMTLLAQAAKALHVAHTKGIIHRDVKPGNLLVRPDGRLVLTDFGIARMTATDRLTDVDEIIGTAAYLAPEQVTGTRVTPATDLYALGVVAYECLAGRHPFVADTAVEVAVMHTSDEPPPLPTTIPEPVRQVVYRALAKKPNARWPTGAALAQAMSQAAAGMSPTPAQATSRSGASSPPPSPPAGRSGSGSSSSRGPSSGISSPGGPSSGGPSSGAPSSGESESARPLAAAMATQPSATPNPAGQFASGHSPSGQSSSAQAVGASSYVAARTAQSTVDQLLPAADELPDDELAPLVGPPRSTVPGFDGPPPRRSDSPPIISPAHAARPSRRRRLALIGGALVLLGSVTGFVAFGQGSPPAGNSPIPVTTQQTTVAGSTADPLVTHTTPRAGESTTVHTGTPNPTGPTATRPPGQSTPPTTAPPPTATASAVPASRAVPLVLGKTEAQARQALLEAGLVPNVEYRPTATQCTVIDQSPDADTLVSPGTTVTIGVAQSPVCPE